MVMQNLMTAAYVVVLAYQMVNVTVIVMWTSVVVVALLVHLVVIMMHQTTVYRTVMVTGVAQLKKMNAAFVPVLAYQMVNVTVLVT